MHTILKGAMKRAVRWRRIARNPLDDVDAPMVERREMKVYDFAQTAALLDTARGERALIPVLATTGLLELGFGFLLGLGLAIG